jgi:hypothetical protein
LFEVATGKMLPFEIKDHLRLFSGHPTVLKRDPRHNFMENIAFLGLSVGPL